MRSQWPTTCLVRIKVMQGALKAHGPIGTCPTGAPVRNEQVQKRLKGSQGRQGSRCIARGPQVGHAHLGLACDARTHRVWNEAPAKGKGWWRCWCSSGSGGSSSSGSGSGSGGSCCQGQEHIAIFCSGHLGGGCSAHGSHCAWCSQPHYYADVPRLEAREAPQK